MIDKCRFCGALYEATSPQLKHRRRQCMPCSKARAQAYRAMNPEKVKQQYKEYRDLPSTKARSNERRRFSWANDPEDRAKTQARDALHWEIRAGRIVKQPCEKCGCAKVHAHHDDYAKPLDVRWLCAAHHREHHKRTDSPAPRPPRES
jgi:hypothetical protein